MDKLTNFNKVFALTSGEKVTIRIPTIEDASALSEYINELVNEDTYISSRKQTKEDEEGYISYMLKKIDAKKEVHLAAFVGNRKVGSVDIFSQGVRKEHIGELQINIKKEFRGKGLGKILLNFAFELVQEELGLKVLTLTCFSNNTNALALYEKVGFKQFGLLPQSLLYKGEYIDEVYMYKNL